MDVDVPAAAEACGTSPATPASAAQAPGQAPESAGTSGAPAPEPKPTVEDVFRKLPRCCIPFSKCRHALISIPVLHHWRGPPTCRLSMPSACMLSAKCINEVVKYHRGAWSDVAHTLFIELLRAALCTSSFCLDKEEEVSLIVFPV